MVLKGLAPIATSDDDDDIVHQIGCMISAQRGSLAHRYRDLLLMHPMEQTTSVERPDIVQHLQPVSVDEYPDFVLVEHRAAHAAQRGNVCGRERRTQPVARQDAEDIHAAVVSCALYAIDDTTLRPTRVAVCARHGSGKSSCISGWDLCIVSVMVE